MAPPAHRWRVTLPRSDRERSLANLPQESRRPTRCRPRVRHITIWRRDMIQRLYHTRFQWHAVRHGVQWSPLESNHNGRTREAPLHHAGSSSGAATTNVSAMSHKPMVPIWTIAERYAEGSVPRHWEPSTNSQHMTRSGDPPEERILVAREKTRYDTRKCPHAWTTLHPDPDGLSPSALMIANEAETHYARI